MINLEYFDKVFFQGVFSGVAMTFLAFFAGYGLFAAMRDGFL